jgi:bifunctional enzyme CysN/CysC
MADESSLEPGRDYIIKHTTRTTRVKVTALDYRLDVNTLHRDKTATALKLNELGRISLRTQVPLLLDEYSRNAATGSFILIDPNTNGTVAAGMILPYVTARTSSPNAVRHESLCTADDRLSHGRTVWFTGLSGSGKSSVAMLVEQKLLEKGTPAYVLDGDNLRHGLNADLGFSMTDRAENQRRLAHIAAILADCATRRTVRGRTTRWFQTPWCWRAGRAAPMARSAAQGGALAAPQSRSRAARRARSPG